MIARSWSARATKEGATSYAAHFHANVLPSLVAIEGHRGALLMMRGLHSGEVEIQVLTFWESLTAIKGFAGADAEAAVVDPEARALLKMFDARARHFDVIEVRRDPRSR
jgi:hypothetical protein